MSTYLTRFTLRQRVEHSLVMSLFIILSLTGLPQKYFEAPWARWMIDMMGGIDRIRWFHRAAGLSFAALTSFHLMFAIGSVARGRSALSIVPNRKDYTDAVQTLQYYLGRSDAPAKFDRFDYRQKFEYWGLVLGAVVVITTGLVLYFPILFTRLFPGELVPAAKVAHSNEGPVRQDDLYGEDQPRTHAARTPARARAHQADPGDRGVLTRCSTPPARPSCTRRSPWW
jgi:formate dehydrogenase subunit gamma